MKKRLFLVIIGFIFVLSACTNSEKQTINETKSETKVEIERETEKETMEESIFESNSEVKETSDEKEEENMSMSEEGVFELLGGGKFNLNEQKGKKVYIKYWASWCPICLSSLEEFDEFSKEENDFEVVSLVAPNFFGEKTREDFKEWFDGLDYKNMKVLIDENGKYVSQFGVNATPVNIIIDSHGEVIQVIPGQLPKDQIKQILDIID